MLDTIKSYWNSLKAFFAYSETIAWSRFQVALGFIIAGFANVDWTALSSLADRKQLVALSIGLIANGFFQEYLRRRGTGV